jgi:hypothetical protein
MSRNCKKKRKIHVVNIFSMQPNRIVPEKPPTVNLVMAVLASRIFRGLVFPTVRPGVSITETRLHAACSLSRICRVPHRAALTGAEGVFQHGMVCLLHW